MVKVIRQKSLETTCVQQQMNGHRASGTNASRTYSAIKRNDIPTRASVDEA